MTEGDGSTGPGCFEGTGQGQGQAQLSLLIIIRRDGFSCSRLRHRTWVENSCILVSNHTQVIGSINF